MAIQTKTKSESNHGGGAFFANFFRPWWSFTLGRGVLSADMAHLTDGALLRRSGEAESPTLTQWSGTGDLLGILIGPDPLEITTGKRRVVYASGTAPIDLSKVQLPEGMEEQATTALATLGFKFITPSS